MNDNQKITTEIKVPNKDLETLKIHFPHYFDKNGNFQINKFKANLTENEINFSTESYGLDWLGKSYARLLASDPTTTLLNADENHNAKPGNTNSENLLIKGDNLEVLKHLVNAYYEQVKMIYIDPPYNTGSDGFVYNDDRKFTVKELQQLIGVDAEKAKRILDFTKQESNSHSAWLTFMYPRLYIAKQLLKDDGVIFVSIDDNEVAQLRLLMDEVFGEENFIGDLIIQTATDNNKTQINVEHEYMLCYCSQKSIQDYWVGKNKAADLIQEKYLALRQEHGKNINEIQNYLRKWIKENKDILPKVTHYDNVDIKGVFHDGDIANTKFGGYKYEVIHPTTGKPCKVPDKGFRFPEETLKKLIEDDDIIFGLDETTLIKPKKRLENAKDVLRSLIYEDGRAASNYVDGLLKRGVFNNPKPHSILMRVMGFVTKSNDIILDFFAGSGTTGDAVMQLNAEDGGNRKFILVQLPEEIDSKKNKAAYDFVTEELKAKPTIFEITKERLLRAAKKINIGLEEKIKKLKADIQTEETKLEIEKLELCKTKNTFKIFETTPIWDDYNFEAEQFDSSQTLFDVGKLSEDDLKALLITWKTYDGTALTQDLESVDLSGYPAYYGNGRLYLINKGFTTANLKALLEKIDTDKYFEPKSIIAFGYHLESKSLREIAENVKTYNNKKKSDIDFITRY